MIDQQQRTLKRPGAGIIRDGEPSDQHSEYPKHMVHPGYQPGKVGTEVKSPHGFSYFVGGESIRFAPVLVMDADQEEYHASQGYVSAGKSDPAAFARAIQAASPQAETHVPDEYPKWIPALNRAVDSAEEEAEALGLMPPAATVTTETGEMTPEAVDVSREAAEVTTATAAPSTDSNRVDALEQEVKRLDGKVDTILSSVNALADLVKKMVAPAEPVAEPERVFAPPHERAAEVAPSAEPEPEQEAPRPRRRRAPATGNGDEPV